MEIRVTVRLRVIDDYRGKRLALVDTDGTEQGEGLPLRDLAKAIAPLLTVNVKAGDGEDE